MSELKEPENREIDGIKYTIYFMSPKKQIKMAAFILKTIGAPAGTLAGSAGLMDTKMDDPVIGQFIEKLIDRIDEDEVCAKIDILLGSVELPGKFAVGKCTMENAEWHGELMSMLKVVAAVMEVNFKDFLGGSTGILESIKGQVLNRLTKSDSPIATG